MMDLKMSLTGTLQSVADTLDAGEVPVFHETGILERERVCLMKRQKHGGVSFNPVNEVHNHLIEQDPMVFDPGGSDIFMMQKAAQKIWGALRNTSHQVNNTQFMLLKFDLQQAMSQSNRTQFCRQNQHTSHGWRTCAGLSEYHAIRPAD
jgi:hypothetical protein